MKNLKLKLTIIGISLLSINAFAQDYVYNGIKNVDATIGMNNSESDSNQETVSADCYDPTNIGKRISAQGCDDLLIVDNDSLRQMVLNDENYADTNIFTGQVTDMSYLFCYYSGSNTTLYNLCTRKNPIYSISNWNTENVTHMNLMFRDSSYNQPLENWDVSNVTNMRYMFYNARLFNQSLNNWVVSNVTNMVAMFRGANTFNKNISNWCVPNISSKPAYFDSLSGFENQNSLQPNWGCN